MKKSRILAAIMTVVMAFSFTACGSGTKTSDANPLMWVVTDDEGGCLYLMGTIHMGDERIKELPERVTDVLGVCDYLAVEFDITETESDMASMIEEYQNFVYTDGTTIQDHVDSEVYEKAKTILEENGLYNAMMDYYMPIMWQQFVNQAYMQNSDLSVEYGADRGLIEYANNNDIEILDIESMSIQMDMLKAFSPELQEFLLSSVVATTSDMYNVSLNAMYEAWVTGDEKQLISIINSENDVSSSLLTEDAQELLDEYNEKMLTVRNENMALAAERYIEGGATVFLAVGAAHMFGDDGIIQLLENKGYTVEKW